MNNEAVLREAINVIACINSDSHNPPTVEWARDVEADLSKLLASIEQAPDAEQSEDNREEAPPHNLPNWSECALRVENSDFIAKRIAEGGYGAEPDSKLATELHRFIYDYDDADSYGSAWFLHRLEKLLDETRAEQSRVGTAEPVLVAWRRMEQRVSGQGWVYYETRAWPDLSPLFAAPVAPTVSDKEPVAPHILESLSWYQHCRDDLTLDEAVDYLQNGWKRVSGRTEQELILQITALLANSPTNPPSSNESSVISDSPASDVRIGGDVPDGFVIIPIEPTGKMLNAMHRAVRDNSTPGNVTPAIRPGYAAAIQAWLESAEGKAKIAESRARSEAAIAMLDKARTVSSDALHEPYGIAALPSQDKQEGM